MNSGAVARRLERLWYGNSPLVFLLLPLSALFALLVRLRCALYERGVVSSFAAGVPVIVVGNITVGGTGKTPLVAWLAGRLRAAGRKPGIVSRGYGGAPHHDAVLVEAGSRAEEVGDEPLMLARRTGLSVAVCIERIRAARMLVAQGADVIVADDGLQHYALARDLEIIVVDGKRRLGNGHMLPAGPLREPAARLRSKALVLVNGGAWPGGAELSFRLGVTDAVGLNRQEKRALALFAGQKVWAVAGIGDPARFYAELQRHGIEPVPVAVPDHGRANLARLREKADWPILMTEKDAVKYPCDVDTTTWYVPAQVEMSGEVEAVVMQRVHAALGRGQQCGS